MKWLGDPTVNLMGHRIEACLLDSSKTAVLSLEPPTKLRKIDLTKACLSFDNSLIQTSQVYSQYWCCCIFNNNLSFSKPFDSVCRSPLFTTTFGTCAASETLSLPLHSFLWLMPWYLVVSTVATHSSIKFPNRILAACIRFRNITYGYRASHPWNSQL